MTLCFSCEDKEARKPMYCKECYEKDVLTRDKLIKLNSRKQTLKEIKEIVNDVNMVSTCQMQEALEEIKALGGE